MICMKLCDHINGGGPCCEPMSAYPVSKLPGLTSSGSLSQASCFSRKGEAAWTSQSVIPAAKGMWWMQMCGSTVKKL